MKNEKLIVKNGGIYLIKKYQHFSLFTLHFSLILSLLCSKRFYLLIIRMHNKEQKVLRLSMTLLFLALMIVYIIWYQVKGTTRKTEKIDDEWSGSYIVSISWNDTIITGQEDTSIYLSGSTTNITTGNITTGTNTTGTVMTGIQANGDIKVLSGTSIYYGKIEIIEKLGIKYQYALTDSTWTWFIYLGTPSYDFASIARALKWSIYTMSTEQEIIENKLFGKKVVFINLPEYKDKQVVMLVYQSDGIRLMQIEYNVYHKSKPYLKSLFID